MMNDHEVWVDRIIPAYAGSTARVTEQRALIGDHPRIRGEHAGGACPFVGAYGSSPHTRGARHVLGRARVRLRIIPAYAGSTTKTPKNRFAERDHPRIRGEHGFIICQRFLRVGSSPHTRGALPGIRWAGVPNGIIPAYAGSTTLIASSFRPGPDHPRIRGEHLGPAHERGVKPGSSPHTRGARPQTYVRYEVYGIIPAYAGSTRRVIGTLPKPADHPRIRGEHFRSGL